MTYGITVILLSYYPSDLYAAKVRMLWEVNLKYIMLKGYMVMSGKDYCSFLWQLVLYLAKSHIKKFQSYTFVFVVDYMDSKVKNIR